MPHGATKLATPYAEDRYPSRQTSRTALMPRLDPVVYCDADASAGGPLDVREVERYERDGFLLVDTLLPPEQLATLHEEVAPLLRAPALRQHPACKREADSNVIRSLFDVTGFSPLFLAAARAPEIIRIAEQLLGSQVYLYQSRLNVKRTRYGGAFNWHSDFETWHVHDGLPRMRMLTCLVCLTANTAFNGPLLCIPGSHRTYFSLPRQTPEFLDAATARRLRQQGGVTRLEGPPGTVAFFDCNLAHSSESNTSRQDRINLYFVYNSVLNPPEAPFSGFQPRPDYHCKRNAGPILPVP